MHRLPLTTPDELPENQAHLLSPHNPFGQEIPEIGDLGEDNLRNIHQIIGNNPDILAIFREYAGQLWTQVLTPAKRELIILKIASEKKSKYEWQQHIGRALESGLTQEEILTITNPEIAALSNDKAVLVDYISDFVNKDVTQKSHQNLRRHFTQADVVAITALAGFYIGVHYQIEALQIPLEGEFVGWSLENHSFES